MKTIVTVLGARPQFIKSALVYQAFENSGVLQNLLIHTGQHFDAKMSDIFFQELGIPEPDYHLGVSGGGHGTMTGSMLYKLEPLLQDIKPEWILVYGDTNSTLAGALAAAKLHIPVAHIEAGLRSFNRRMPEEINRILTDQLSTILFCPTDTAVENLRREGFPQHQTLSHNSHSMADKRQQILNVGDVMYDAALHYAIKAEASSQILNAHGLERKDYVLATVHRAENTDESERLRAIMHGLDAAAKQLPVLLPLHPRTRAALDREHITLNHIRLIDPLGYLDMVALEANAAVIATDSGGVQKEAYFHGVPCVTLRDETEWTELVEAGWNRLAPPGRADIADAILVAVGKTGQNVRPYGKGDAADQIVQNLVQSDFV